MKRVVSVGGVDPCGYAGLLVDQKTFLSLGLQSGCVVAAVTAQSVDRFHALRSVPPEIVIAQLEGLLLDGPLLSMKTGLLGAESTVRALASWLSSHRIPLVVDPILRSTSGRSFSPERMVRAYHDYLLPQATVATPNIHEASLLSGMSVADLDDMQKVAEILGQTGSAILVTGGHLDGDPVDVLWDRGDCAMIPGIRVPGRWRGAGCTFSAALAALLSLGYSLLESVRLARRYVTAAMQRSLAAGDGRALIHPIERTMTD